MKKINKLLLLMTLWLGFTQLSSAQVLFTSSDRYTGYKYGGFIFNNQRWLNAHTWTSADNIKVWRDGDKLSWSVGWNYADKYTTKGSPWASIGSGEYTGSSDNWATNSPLYNVKLKDVDIIKGDWTFPKPEPGTLAGYPFEQYHYYYQIYMSTSPSGYPHTGDIAIVLFDNWYYQQPDFGSPVTINGLTYKYKFIPQTGHGPFLQICLPNSHVNARQPDADGKFRFTNVDIDGIIKWAMSQGMFSPELYLTHISNAIEVQMTATKTFYSDDMKYTIKHKGQTTETIIPSWKGNTAPVAVTGISVTPSSATIRAGATTQLGHTVSPSYATNQGVTWTSSNPAVATVNASGLVTGVAQGIANITVRTNDGNKTATCAVTVNPAPAPGENLLTNGDFSNGLTGWLFAANGTTSSASVSNGEAVINITTAGTNAWEPQFVKDGFALISGQQYTVSFQARAATNRNIQLFVNTGPNNYASFFTQSVPLTTAMQTFTYTFTANANDDNARIDFNCGGNTANVIIDNVSIITGSVAPVTYVLTVNGGSGSGNYEAGAVVNITANAAPAGKVFDKWTGSAAIANVNLVSTTITMPSAATSITATYKDAPVSTYALTVNSGSGSGNYAAGSVVSIVANTAPAGQIFDKWTGDVAHIANVNSASTTTTMPATPVSITATYKSISQGAVQAGIISSTAGSQQTGNLKEHAYDGNASSRWANNGTLTNAWIEFKLDRVYDIENIEVLFFNGNSRTYPLSITLNGNSIWSGNSSLTSGYWTRTLSGRGDLLRISMTGNNSDGSAWFSINEIRINGVPVNQHTLTVNSGSGSGSYSAGTVVNITASNAPAGQRFAQWTGDVANVASINNATTTLTMPASNVSITATYENIPVGSTNLVLNPGFENDATHWNIPGGFTITTADSNSGAKSLRMNGTGTWGNVWQSSINVVPNTNYTYSIYAKGNASVFMKVFTSGWGTIAERFANPTNAWTKYSLDFNSGSNSTILISMMDGGSGITHIDDVEIVVNLNKSATANEHIDNVAMNEIVLYPNPIKDGEFNLFLPYSNDTEIYIYDMTGKSVMIEKVNQGNNKVKVGQLSNGLYLVVISSNKEVITKKILIER